MGCSPGGDTKSDGGQLAGEPAESGTPQLASRTADVEFAGGRVSVHSNEALRLSILEKLAAQADFELVVGDLEPRSMTLRIDDTRLADALPVLLEGVPYGANYSTSERGHRLVRLRVGEVIEVAEMPRGVDASQRRRGDNRAERQQRQIQRREEFERVFDDLEELTRGSRNPDEDEMEELSQQVFEQLRSPDPGERTAALSLLPDEGAHLPRVIPLLESDPDPGVRVAAASWLAVVGSHGAVSALIGALGDPAPEVKLKVIEALEFTGDESVAVHLQPLLLSPDPEVRDAAEEAIAFLE
jgi:hypothetical protein